MRYVSFFGMAILAGAISSTGLSEDQLRITLTFMPNEDLKTAPVVSTRPIEILPLTDVRVLADRTLVGENRQKSVARPIRAMWVSSDGKLSSSPVSDFSTFVLKKCLSDWGARVEKGGLLLRGEITSLLVTEENRYSTQASLRFRLEDQAGGVLWEGTVSGDSSQFGRSFSYENYKEQISNVLAKTYGNLISDPGFQTAWRGEVGVRKSLSSTSLKAEIVKMIDAGVGVDVIVGYVRGVKIEPALTPEEIIEWKTSHITEAVIAAAVGR